MPYVTLPRENHHLKLYYQLHGDGETKILFIMGLLTEGSAWIRQVNRRVFSSSFIFDFENKKKRFSDGIFWRKI